MNDFGRRLRQLRAENALTQDKLREELNTKGHNIPGKSTISRWENGSRKPKMEVIEDLEDILGVDRGVLLKLAGYLVETSQEQFDYVIVKQTAVHFADLADIAKSLLANGLGSVSCPGWSTNRSQQVKYVIPNANAASQYDELTKEQLTSLLNNNIAAITKDKDWLFRHCFIPHLKSELPGELRTKLFFEIIEEQPYKLIETLRVLAAKKTFKGTCPACPGLIS